MDIVALHASGKPDQLALVQGDREVTWAEYDEAKNRFANALLTLGVEASTRLVAFHHNCVEGFMVQAAADALGITVVPMNHRLTAPEVAYIVNDCEATVVVFGEEFGHVVEDVIPEAPSVKHWVQLHGVPLAGTHGWEALLDAASPEKPASLGEGGGSMIYTSGTTGKPKGAYRKPGGGAAGMMQFLQNVMAEFDIRPDDAHLAAGPLYHSAPRALATVATTIGKTIVVMQKFDAGEALRLVGRWKVGDTFLAPILVQRLLAAPDEAWQDADLSSLHTIVMAGAPCPMWVKEEAARKLGDVLYEFYGSTELAINTVLEPGDQLRKPGSCGRPFPGIELALFDSDGKPVADGEPGEVFVRRNPLVISEYYGKPDALAESTVGGEWVSVGDVAYRDDEGFIFICDRKKDMIISGGVNIYPAEVESVLHEHPAVADVAVFGIPNAEWGESVHAVLQLEPGTSLTEDEVSAWCSDRLADYKRPRSMEVIEALPRDQAGKLLKRQLRDKFWAAEGKQVN